MFFEDREERIKTNKNNSKELEIRIEALNKEADQLLKDFDITHEQLKKFIENQENFSEKNWKTIEQLQVKQTEQLQREIDHVPNLKKKRGEPIAQHWLFVR